jgi:hypothetical protein
MWGARGSFPPTAAMVVMVAVGSWSLEHASTVGIVYVFYDINLFFGINIYAGIKSIYSPCPDRADKMYLCVYSRYSSINRKNKFYTNNVSHTLHLKLFLCFLQERPEQQLVDPELHA